MIFLLLVKLLFVVAAFAVYKVRKMFLYWNDRGVNYEEPVFPFGNIKGLGKDKHFSEFNMNLYEKFKRKGRFFGMFFFINKVFVITDLDLIKQIFIKDFSNFNERGLYHNKRDDPISEHLLTLDGKSWKAMRSKLSPTFTSAKMKFMFPTVQKVGEEFVEVLEKVVENEDEIDIKELLARFTTDVIGTCAFGIECNSLRDPNAEFRLYGRKVVEYQQRNTKKIIFQQNFQKIAKFLRMRLINPECSTYFIETVKETVKYREQNNFRRNDFMDLLIDLKNNRNEDNPEGLTYTEVAAQSFIFILAGFETSSSTMSFMLHELASHPEIQSKLRSHLKEVLQRHNGEITYECMKEMTYLEQVIMETIRKYPIIPNLLRLTQEDYHVPDSNLILEKGMSVLIPIRAIHYDEDIYPNPHKFNPDRFSPEEMSKRHPQSFLGFGDGPRNCIGSRFAKMQMYICITSLITNFELTTDKPLTLSKEGFLLGTKDGIYLKIKRIRK
ncbi:Cyp6a9.2 family protein [Megaselia abdita]